MSQARGHDSLQSAPPDADPREPFVQSLRCELDRRIAELATCAQTESLSAIDWLATLGLFVLLPLFIVWVLR